MVMSKLGRKASCRTMIEDISPPAESLSSFHRSLMASKYGIVSNKVADHCLSTPMGADEACSCEAVTRGELEFFASYPDVRSPADLMRRTRAGMGFCQAGLCAFRIAALLPEGDPIEAAESFLDERWKGIAPVLQGEQLRQEVFKAHILKCYGLDHTGGGRR